MLSIKPVFWTIVILINPNERKKLS